MAAACAYAIELHVDVIGADDGHERSRWRVARLGGGDLVAATVDDDGSLQWRLADARRLDRGGTYRDVVGVDRRTIEIDGDLHRSDARPEDRHLRFDLGAPLCRDVSAGFEQVARIAPHGRGVVVLLPLNTAHVVENLVAGRELVGALELEESRVVVLFIEQLQSAFVVHARAFYRIPHRLAGLSGGGRR